MSRKERRAAVKRSRIAAHHASGGVTSSVGDFFAKAVEYQQTGNLGESENCYRRALDGDPNHLESLKGYGKLLLDTGNAAHALPFVARALTNRETEETRALFVACLQSTAVIADVPGLQNFAMRAISEPWTRPSDLMDAVTGIVKGGDIADYVRRATLIWPKRPPAAELFGPAGPTVLGKDRLLQSLLESVPVCDVELERFLTLARHAMLEIATREAVIKRGEETAMRFFTALAGQCFINEYVFTWTADEIERAKRLRDSVIEALKSGGAVAALSLAAVAAYYPLHSLPASDLLLQKPWRESVKRLLARQVREPMAEAEYRSSLPRLTEIEDEVSLAVQQQYEANPFPRWVKAALAAKPVPLDQELRRKFPSASFHDLGKTADLDYLVAGCGTGLSAEEAARTFAGVRVLAVDLSRASLAYAKRKADEEKLTNMDFAQADILKLASVGRTFDGIDCSGVLHHMAEPLQGWRVLLSLLRLGGFMRVGLYSEIARKDIVAAQRFAADHGYRPCEDDIRRCRQEILDLPPETPIRNVIKMRDFFTTSGCRDLLFHVQEHRLTIPEIARFLADNGLVFLGFDLHRSILERFEKSFPQAGSAQDLLLWHAFEQKNPRTFIGMYQFWVQKRAA